MALYSGLPEWAATIVYVTGTCHWCTSSTRSVSPSWETVAGRPIDSWPPHQVANQGPRWHQALPTMAGILSYFWGPIHRNCPKIYPTTCHKIILWQKLRRHRMILWHILSQFTKFVLGDHKDFQDMTRYHSNYDVHHGFIYGCVYDTGTRTYFTSSLRFPHLYLYSTKCTTLPLYCH